MMMDYQLYENKPAENFWDEHYLGNGRLGLSVPGDAPIEEIVVNEDTFWSGSEAFHHNDEHYENMLEARKLALEGKLAEANEIVCNGMDGCWSQTYLPMASIYLTVGHKNNRRTMNLKKVLEYHKKDILDYSRILNLNEAVETVSWMRDGIRYKKEYFVSHPADAAFILIQAEDVEGQNKQPLSFAMAADSKIKHTNGADNSFVFVKGIAPDHAEPEYTPVNPRHIYGEVCESKALRFACCAQVIDTDGEITCDGARVYVNHAGYALIAVQARTNYAGYKKERISDENQLLNQVSDEIKHIRKEYAELKKDHIRDYQELFGRVDLSLCEKNLYRNIPVSERIQLCIDGVDDPDLAALMLQYSRYLTISASRPGTQPMNLQGIWNDRIAPSWASNYTNNINLQMNYWPSEVLALQECHMPLMEFLKEAADAGKQTAREYYHLDGWVMHHNSDLWRTTEPACESSTWSWWQFGGAWLCQHIWTHYEFTKDRVFLKEMYPILREAARFMLGLVVENKDGYLVTAPSVSPENRFFWGEEKEYLCKEDIFKTKEIDYSDGGAVGIGATIDISILRELFGNLEKAAEELGMEDEIVPEVREAVKKLPPFKTGRYGQLLEWYEDYDENLPGNGHISHMYPVYPGNLITWEKTPELMDAAKRSLERRMLHSDHQACWPGAWRVSLMARFKSSYVCGELIKQFGKMMGAGMLCLKWNQIDAILGMGAGIAEMLLQSHAGYLELIPTLPVDWANGEYNGIRARGGFSVSAKWKRGKLTGAYIESLCGEMCAVKAVGVKKAVHKDQEYIAVDDMVSFPTQKGERIELLF